MDKIYFVLPAYNEEANIEDVVNQWYPVVEKLGGESKLVIANDGSKDNTIGILRSLAQTRPQLEVIDKPNSGHGATVLHLYRHAIKAGANWIFQTDSDGQTLPEEFLTFYNDRDNYDFLIGHRQGRQDGASRVFVTKTLRLVVWLMFHQWVTDANTPFRLMRSDKLQEIMNILPPDFFLCNVAISAIALRWKMRVKFYPITFKPRQGGENSINMKRITKIGWKAIGEFRDINRKIAKR